MSHRDTIPAMQSAFQLSDKIGQLIIATLLLMSAIESDAQSFDVLPQPMVSLAAPAPDTNRGAFTAFWSHPTNTSDIAAYRLAWGTNALLLNNSTQVGKSVTNISVRGLVELRTYYLSLVSVGTNGAESVAVTNTHFTQPLWRFGTYSTFFSVPCPSGRTNLIQSSTNGGMSWRNILTNTTGGNVTLLRTNSAIAPGVTEIFRLK